MKKSEQIEIYRSTAWSMFLSTGNPEWASRSRDTDEAALGHIRTGKALLRKAKMLKEKG